MQREHYEDSGGRFISELFESDRAALLPLPAVPFDTALYTSATTNKYGKFSLDKGKHIYSASPSFSESVVQLKITSSEVVVMDSDLHEIVRHRRLYGDERESMDWIPYLRHIARRPRSLKNSGIYGMMPEVMQEYMDRCESSERGKVLKVLAELTERSGFDSALNTVSEAVRLHATDPDSLQSLYRRIYTDVPLLPPLEAAEGIPPLKVIRFPDDLTGLDAILKGVRQMDNELRDMIASCCKSLKLSSNLADRAMIQKGATNQEFLYNLLNEEIRCRRERRIAKLINTADFPRLYSRDQFRTDEIDFPEGITLDSLLDLEFQRSGKNLIMYGATGTGKTMLSILIGLAACRADIPVRFYRTAGLINRFSEGHKKGTLEKLKKKLNEAQILILDEFGYVPYDRTGSQLLFDYLSEIHEQKSVILNTNLEFSQWVNVLYDKRMTTALIGRLTHHVELILFPGGNNRLRESSINKAFSRVNAEEVSHG